MWVSVWKDEDLLGWCWMRNDAKAPRAAKLNFSHLKMVKMVQVLGCIYFTTIITIIKTRQPTRVERGHRMVVSWKHGGRWSLVLLGGKRWCLRQRVAAEQGCASGRRLRHDEGFAKQDGGRENSG